MKGGGGEESPPPFHMTKKSNSIFSTNNSTDRVLMRCQCSELFWEDSPQEVLKSHDGHRYSPAMNGSFLEFVKMKLGLIR